MSYPLSFRKWWAAPAVACALAALSISTAGMANAKAGLKPSPVRFPHQYGNMIFPARYPDGTSFSITQWSDFVPAFDQWFDRYARKWGKAHNVDVTVNHISYADLASTLAASIAAGRGATLFQMIAGPSAFINELKPLNDVNVAAKAAFGERAQTCRHTTYLPAKDMWYGFCLGWAPDPGVYRKDLWKAAGYPDGPESYADLLKGGSRIFRKTGVAVGVGLSPGVDSEFFARALIWSFGGSVQDKNGDVVLDSPQTLAALRYIRKLFHNAMTPSPLSWNAASNNQTFIAGTTSYIQNSISFFRSAQDIDSPVVAKTGFRPGLKGPDGDVHNPAHLWFIDVMPNYVIGRNRVLAAKNFLLDLENNYSNATYQSKLYNFPAFRSRVPQLYAKHGWLEDDPYGSRPADKLAILKTAAKWTVWLGYPGYANPAIGELYQTHILSTMVANVARGAAAPQQALDEATARIDRIFKKWRKRGYVGSGNK